MRKTESSQSRAKQAVLICLLAQYKTRWISEIQCLLQNNKKYSDSSPLLSCLKPNTNLSMFLETETLSLILSSANFGYFTQIKPEIITESAVRSVKAAASQSALCCCFCSPAQHSPRTQIVWPMEADIQLSHPRHGRRCEESSSPA